MATRHNNALLVLLVLALAGCGGGNSTTASTADPPSSAPTSAPSGGDTGSTGNSSGSTGSTSSGSTGSTDGGGGTSSGDTGSGSTAPVVTPPVVTPPASQAASAYEGIWAGPSTHVFYLDGDIGQPLPMPVYPGFIVDARGVFWFENFTWGCTLDAAGAGTLSPGGTASVENDCFGTSAPQGDQGPDTLAITSAAVSGGVMTLEGTLTGNVIPSQTGNGVVQGPPDPSIGAGQWAWTDQLMLDTSQPLVPLATLIAAYAGAGGYTTALGDWVINADGSFILWDFGGGGRAIASNCVYTGTVTQLDPTQGIYSLTATVSQGGTDSYGETADGPCTDPVVAAGGSATAYGVFIIDTYGYIDGGLSDGNGAIATVDL